jgi:FAD:protein FMN transferase
MSLSRRKVLFACAGGAAGLAVGCHTVVSPDFNRAEEAIDAGFAELDRLEDILSLYRPHSQLCRLNREGRLDRADADLLAVLLAAQRVSRMSGGAFDVTVQPLWAAYASAARRGTLPTEDELTVASRLVDYRRLQVSERDVRFTYPGMAATLNGIAQGYAVDRVLAALREHGVEQALVNAGELGALGSRIDGDAWRAGVNHPRQSDSFVALADLDGRALATSGDYATRFGEGFNCHHLLDPRTGRSATWCQSVSVVAPSGLEADALSTAFFIAGPAKGMELLRRCPGVDVLCVLADGRVQSTPGFPLAKESRA